MPVPTPPAARRCSRWSGVALLLVSTALTAGAQLPAGTRAGAWQDLLAGGAARHWREYRQETLPAGWQYDAATNTLTRRSGKDIITREQYGDFELELEWQVGPKGNSGIFYRATESTDVIYENATEMQVLDNAGHRDGASPLTSAGANYALYAPVRDVSRPAGEWNRVRIVAVGPHVEHWLNDVKILEYEAWTPEWTAKVKASKFDQWPPYGLARRGHIGLQDHGDPVWYRDIKIRVLD